MAFLSLFLFAFLLLLFIFFFPLLIQNKQTPYADNLIKMTKDPTTFKITTKTLVAVRYSDLFVPSEREMKLAEIEAQRCMSFFSLFFSLFLLV